jgi:tetratricopeptide (TPR) repeat protein
VWRRYFKESGVGVLAAGTLALGLGNFVPAILGRCDVYEVAISCGYALTMLALGGVWCALHDERRRWRWLAAASLAYGLAVGARPSLLLGAVILLAPVFQAWQEKRRVWPLLAAAVGPMVAIGLGLMFYNELRFDNPLEFGQRYQLPLTVHQQFRLRFLWFNFRVGFLEPAHWSGRFPFVDNIVAPAAPAGYGDLNDAYGILTNIPLVWLALAAPAAWRGRPGEARSKLRRFFVAVALLFGMCALPLVLHDSMCVRYETEYASPLLLLAAVGVFGLERALGGQPAWRRAARCGWGLLLAFTVAFNLFAGYKSNTDDHENFGFALLQTGRNEEAITQLQKAVQLEPGYASAQVNLGNAYQQTGRTEEAIAHFLKALEIAPDAAAAHYSLAVALVDVGRVDEGIAHYQKALQFKPDYAYAHSNLGIVLAQQGKLDEAIAHFQKAVEIKPDFALVHNNLGNALQQKGRVDEAIAHYQKALQIKPDYAEAHFNLGIALAQQGRAEEAFAHLQKAVELNPGFAPAHHGLGNALQQKGRLDEALIQYQAAYQINPADPAIQNDLAWLLAAAPETSLRNGAKAMELARQANLLTGGENPVILHTLAAACAEAGRFSEAVETAQHALRLAEAHSNTVLAGALQSELKLYQTNSPLPGPAQSPH